VQVGQQKKGERRKEELREDGEKTQKPIADQQSDAKDVPQFD
jgi:hypothetical protein